MWRRILINWQKSNYNFRRDQRCSYQQILEWIFLFFFINSLCLWNKVEKKDISFGKTEEIWNKLMVSTPQKKCTHKMRVFFVIMICRGFFLLNTRQHYFHLPPRKKNNKIFMDLRECEMDFKGKSTSIDNEWRQLLSCKKKIVITFSSYLIYFSIVLKMMKFCKEKQKFNRDKNHSINWLKHTCALNSKNLCQSMVNHKVTIVVKIYYLKKSHMCVFINNNMRREEKKELNALLIGWSRSLRFFDVKFFASCRKVIEKNLSISLKWFTK